MFYYYSDSGQVAQAVVEVFVDFVMKEVEEADSGLLVHSAGEKVALDMAFDTVEVCDSMHKAWNMTTGA